MPFNFYYPQQLKKLISKLHEARYKNIVNIRDFETYEDDGEIGLRSPISNEMKPMKIGENWGGCDKYLWLCFNINIPDEFVGKDVCGIFDFGETGGGNNSKFESLLYINDEPYQALDSNHMEVFFDTSVLGQEIQAKVRLWSGLNGGGPILPNIHQLKRADLAILDYGCDKLYYMSKNVLETIEVLDDNDPTKEKLLRHLVNAFKKVEFSYVGSDEFYQQCASAYEYICDSMNSDVKLDVNVSLIGHTHIDVAWLWRLKHTREKCARSFASVNRLMQRYPEYKFIQTQAQLYDYIKTDYPDIYEQIKELVAQGKWEPAGSMWVECDCNVVSGESLVRQILYGKNFFEKEFGYTNDFLWLPDVFGYSWALPQILKKSGIKSFVTTKISWNETNKMPYDTFKWRGIDGSEVTTHFITTPPDKDNYWFYTYNGYVDPMSIKGVWSNYANKDLTNDLLISYGYGDGGGGVNRDMLENYESISKIEGSAKVKSEFVKDYLDRLNDTIDTNANDVYIPTWDGELYLELHRGTYTTQAYVKKTNRYLEFLTRDTEMLSALAMISASYDYPQNDIYEAWKIILCSQFHDIIPGSSIHEVYEDCHIDYAIAQGKLDTAMNNAIETLTTDSDGYSVINTRSWKRDAIVELENGKEVLLKDIPPMSSMKIQGDAYSLDEIKCDERIISTPFYTIIWNENGHLTSVFDKESSREVILSDNCANVFQIFEDIPRAHEAWDIDVTYEDKMDTIKNLVETKVSKSPLYTCVDFKWTYKSTTICQQMKLYNHTKRIDFETYIDWQEREKLLKVAFPVDIRATTARYDIQFGNIQRPITRNNSWDYAKFEVVAHKWADLYETNFGVALLNDSKYGYDIKDSTMRLSLLKASNHPDHSADKGEHTFIYSILPHTQDWNIVDIEKHSYEINTPLIPVKGTLAIDNFIVINNDNIIIDSIKKAEDSNDIILRFHEYKGARNDVKVELNLPYSQWVECDLMEKPISDVTNDEASLFVKPYEIKTICFKF